MTSSLPLLLAGVLAPLLLAAALGSCDVVERVRAKRGEDR